MQKFLFLATLTFAAVLTAKTVLAQGEGLIGPVLQPTEDGSFLGGAKAPDMTATPKSDPYAPHPFVGPVMSMPPVMHTGPAQHLPASLNRRMEAAGRTALKNLRCIRLEDFYWEVGDKNGTQARGWVGHKFKEDTPMPIATSSQLVFAAYVVEKTKGQLDATQIEQLNMKAGYTEQPVMACEASKTIGDCLTRMSEPDTDMKGRFFYSAGNAQRMAVEMGLGAFTGADMLYEYSKYIGNTGFTYIMPSVSTGLRATPKQYAAFLRDILSGKLKIREHLGASPVCTTPSDTCTDAVYSPSPRGWHYSLHHWIESGEGSDGAFSSPGILGFYPWISADKETYGIIARTSDEYDAYYQSYQCGFEIRQAWASGEARE